MLSLQTYLALPPHLILPTMRLYLVALSLFAPAPHLLSWCEAPPIWTPPAPATRQPPPLVSVPYFIYLLGIAKNPIPDKMFGTKIKILQHVLTILETETKGQQLLLAQGIDSISKLIHTKHKIYRSLVYRPHCKFFLVDIDQILLFKKWHCTTFTRTQTTTEVDILYKLTEEEWDRFCNAYISEKLHNQSQFQTHTVSSPYMEDPTV